MEDRKLYENVYRYAQKKAEENEQQLILPETAFVSASLQHPCCLDRSRISALDFEDYIYTVFWALYNRVPTESDLAFWQKKEQKYGKDIFQKKLCRRVTRRIEAKMKNVCCTDQDFPGLGEIPYTKKRIDPDHTFGKFYYYFCLPVFHSILTSLYGLYRKTLRPVRQWFRSMRHR